MVETDGSLIAGPDIQGDVVAADGLSISPDELKQCRTDVPASDVLIYADIIYIERLAVLHEPVVLHFVDLAESIALHAVIVIDKDGFAGIADHSGQLLLAILGGMCFEQIRTKAVVHHIYLMQQINNTRYIRNGILSYVHIA